MPDADFFIRKNDTASILTDTVTDAAGAAVNIAGAGIVFHLAPINGSGTPTINKAATNAQVGDGSDGSKGHVSYTWLAGETAQAGLYLGEWRVTFAGGAVQTFPNASYILVRVTEAVL